MLINLLQKKESLVNNIFLMRGFDPGEDIFEFAKENMVDGIIIAIKKK